MPPVALALLVLPPVSPPPPAPIGAAARQLCPPAAAVPRAPRGVSPAALASLVAAERAFARVSVDSGAQAAFLANLADSAVLFRPGPVPGRAFQTAHPIPADAGTLAWTPQWAVVSRAGDLGVTSGPWTATSDGRVVGHGTFNSVWVREDHGSGVARPWRVLLDVGAGDSAAVRRPAAVAGVAACGPVAAAPAGASRPPWAGARDAALRAVWRADSLAGRPDVPGGGLGAALAPDARLVREHAPVMAAASAREEARRAGARLTGAPIAAGVARSGDLAYSYGAYVLAGPSGAPGGSGAAAERGHYLRVWRAGPAGWTLLLDVANPLPAPPTAAPSPAAPPTPSSRAAPP